MITGVMEHGSIGVVCEYELVLQFSIIPAILKLPIIVCELQLYRRVILFFMASDGSTPMPGVSVIQ